MQTSASDPDVFAAERRARQASAEDPLPHRQTRKPPRPNRSVSHEPGPVPLKDKIYTAFSRLRYGMATFVPFLPAPQKSVFLALSFRGFSIATGWNFNSSVEIHSRDPIWLLGVCYHDEERSYGELNKLELLG